MPVERVYATIYYVDDWEKSVAFYRDVLGLKPVHVEKGWAEFEIGDARIALHLRDAGDPADVTQVSLQVRDIEATVRERLRVLEQRINGHPKRTDEDRVQLQDYITRAYGSLTTFNVLFAEPEDRFIGTKGGEE